MNSTIDIDSTDFPEYFKLNGQKLDANNKFKLLNTVFNFYPENYEKIPVKFINYGDISNKV